MPGGLNDQFYRLESENFLLSKVLANLVHKHDVVRLRHGQLGGVGTEGETLDNITSLAVLCVGWLRAELVCILVLVDVEPL